MTAPSRSLRTLSALLALALSAAAACSGSEGVVAPPDPPTIQVDGIADGVTYAGSVTFTIHVDRGSWQATLNGGATGSTRTLSTPGSYTLRVTARDGLATSTVEISFAIAGAEGGTLLVRVLDLGPNDTGGGGDAILISDSSAAGIGHALIDAGAGGADASDPGRVARMLADFGVDTLRLMVLSHAHSDHFQGMTDVLNDVHVEEFQYNGQARNLSFYQSLLTLAHARAQAVVVPADTMTIQIGWSAVASTLTMVPGLPTYLSDPNAQSDELNEGSLGALLRRGDVEMFFTGDGEVEANQRWRTQFAELTGDVDILKVGHHAANNAVFDNGFNGASAWLEHTSPSIAVISANGTSHPRMNALAELLGRPQMETYCTNVHGTITLRIYSDGQIAVEVERNAGAACVAGSDATT